MIRSISIFFLLLHLLTSTELCQVLRIPVLINHYTEHRSLNTGITFFMFLKMHYFNGDPRDSDYDRDMQLPFKTSANSFVLNLNLSHPVVPQNFLSILTSDNLPSDYTDYFSCWIPCGHLKAIFQPPRAI